MNGPIGGVDAIAPGDHVCVMHTSIPRRDDVLLPFLRDGLVAGHKCVAALTDADLNDLQWRRLGSRAEVERWLASRQLEMHGQAEHVSSSDTWSVARMIAFWEGAQSSELNSGRYDYTRFAAEASWWLPQLSGVTQMLRFESILNRLSARNAAATLCLYDISSLDGALMMDLISTHPKLVVEGVPLDNPAFIPAEYFDG